MRIALITDSFPPEVRSASHLMFELGEYLVRRGHDVSVLTCEPQYNIAAGTGHAKRGWVDVTHEHGMRVARVRTLPVHNVGPLVRGIAQLTLPLFFLNAARRLPRPDCSIIYSPPLPLGLVGAGLRRPYVLNVQDLFPQNAIDLGVLRSPPLIALFRAIETFLYRRASVLAVHSEGNQRALLERRDLPQEEVVVAHNWVDCEVPTRETTDGAYRRAQGWENRFVVLFAGVMGYAQDLDTVLDAAALLRDLPAVRFVLVGDGVVRARLERRVAEERLENVELRPFVSREAYPELVASVDAGLVTLKDTMRTPVVPSKLLGYMAAACPAVASLNAESDGHAIVRDSGCGISTPAGDAAALAAAVRQLASDPAAAREMGRRGRAYALAHFERDACAAVFEALCHRVSGSLSSGQDAGGSAAMGDYEQKLQRERRWYTGNTFRADHFLNSRIFFSMERNDFNYVFPRRRLAALIERTLRARGVSAPTMLIAPIGVGGDLPYLRPLAGRVVGVDISEEALASVTDPAIETHVADMRYMPIFADGTFDVVVVPLFFHHFVRYGFDDFLLEARRVLKPGGLFFSLEPGALYPLTWLAWLLKAAVGNIMGAVEDEAAFLPYRLSTAMRRCGFEEVGIHGASFTHNRTPVPVARVLNAVTRPLLDLPLIGACAWMCAFRGRKPMEDGSR